MEDSQLEDLQNLYLTNVNSRQQNPANVYVPLLCRDAENFYLYTHMHASEIRATDPVQSAASCNYKLPNGSQTKLLHSILASGHLCCKDPKHADHSHAAVVQFL